MKTYLLLPILFIVMFLAGCQHPDDDVDMPKPGKSIAEMIKGEWVLYESIYITDDGTGEDYVDVDRAEQPFRFDENSLYFATKFYRSYEEEDTVGFYLYSNHSPYFLINKKNATYIHYNVSANPTKRNHYPEYEDWEIASITDSTMVWKQHVEGSISIIQGNYFETYQDYTYKFRRKKPSEY